MVGGEDAINIGGNITIDGNNLFLDSNSSSIDGYYINSQLEISGVSGYGYITDYDPSTREITVDWYNPDGQLVSMPPVGTNTSYEIYLHKSGQLNDLTDNILSLNKTAVNIYNFYKDQRIVISNVANDAPSYGIITSYNNLTKVIDV